MGNTSRWVCAILLLGAFMVFRNNDVFRNYDGAPDRPICSPRPVSDFTDTLIGLSAEDRATIRKLEDDAPELRRAAALRPCRS